MDHNDKITAETWGKLFAVLPKSKVLNLRCVVVCSSGILECPLSWGRGAAPLYTKLWRAEYVPPPHYSLDGCRLGDKAVSKLAEVLPHTKLVNLK